MRIVELLKQRPDNYYEIADYGLSEEQIQTRFADYRARFGV